MAEWDTEEHCRSAWIAAWNEAWQNQEDAMTDRGKAWDEHNYITDTRTKACTGYLCAAISDITKSIRNILYTDGLHYPQWCAIYYSYFYTGGDEYELTWEKIVAAWAEADTLGRLWTTLSIDFMRKEVWNEPVTDFALRSGKPSE